MNEEKKLSVEEIAIFCKKKGFVFRAAEIYGGLSGFFDFGPLGVELKNNLKQEYWRKFVLKREDCFGQDGAIITNPTVWKASGHVDTFADLILTTKKTKTKIRADHFIEDTLKIPADGLSAQDIQKLIDENNLTYNGEEFEEIKDFNLMFQTQVGADTTKNSTAYLRPETCQSIFPNFKLIAEGSRAKLPFGICQIGKAFRNEISPRDFIFRCREFEQMEMEYFYNPEKEFDKIKDRNLKLEFSFLSAETQDLGENKIEKVSIEKLIEMGKINRVHGYLLSEFYLWLVEDLGIDKENLRVREHVKTELSHYSSATLDIDYKFGFGFKELLGVANRGSYDLKKHQEFSKTKLEIFDEETKKKILPHVIEPSLGVERLFMAMIYENYIDDEKRGNVVLNLPNKLAPYKVAIFPLMNKPELVEVARELFDEFVENDIVCVYDKSGSIGKRYARYDEIGTPYCLTIDYETIEDGENKGTITIRDRNSTKQKRIDLKTASGVILSLINGKIKFEDL